MQLLENDIIRLRAMEPEDLELLYQWENNSLLWDKGETVSPYSRYALKQYISESHRGIYELKQLRLMIEVVSTGEAVGMIDLYDFDVHNKKAGVGILIDDTYQRKGFGLQSLKLITGYAFSFLNLHQLYAYIAVTNTASIQLFIRGGFTLAGTLKDWITSRDGFLNVGIYQLLKK